jgi:hypothetical protein
MGDLIKTLKRLVRTSRRTLSHTGWHRSQQFNGNGARHVETSVTQTTYNGIPRFETYAVCQSVKTSAQWAQVAEETYRQCVPQGADSVLKLAELLRAGAHRARAS